jgi:hypothetical protein
MARNKTRKWSNLKGAVPDAPDQVELTPRMLEIFQEKDARAAKTMDELTAEYAALEEEEAYEALAAAKRSILYEALDRRILEELDKIKAIAGTDMWRGQGRTASPKYTPNPIVKDPAALKAWIKDNKLEDLLTLSSPRLKSIVCEALDSEIALALTPAQRAQLKPGEPGSSQPPPGVEVFLRTSVHHTSAKRRAITPDDDVETPF